jgi:uncharacterized LabA/DUF88 family protein
MVREIRVVTDEDEPKSAKTAPKATSGAKKSRRQRVAVFIDGSNLYFKLRTLIPHKMDFIRYRYGDMVESLLTTDERLVYTGYYVGVVRDTKRSHDLTKTADLIQNQQKLFEQLRHQQIEIVKGYLLERDGKFFEKGVDVRLAVDIVTMAQVKKYDTAIIISSDTDLIPAMQAAQRMKREIVHVGFEHQPSLSLIRYANRSRLITRPEAEKYQAGELVIRRFEDQ